jgi:hypothetical protein
MILARLEKVYFPFFFSIYVVIAFYAHNIDHVSFVIPFITMLVNVFITAGLFFLLNSVIKNPQKSGLILGVILTGFFTYGHLHGFIHNILLNKIFLLDTRKIREGVKAGYILHFILLAVYALISFFLFRWILKRESFKVINALNIITAVLVGTAVFNILSYKFTHKNTDQIKSEVNIYNVEPPDVKRDIYYIILDGYGRADYLQKYFNYNNDSFLKFLSSKNFFVADKGRSNYAWTFLSLPSSLNVNYLDKLNIPLLETKSTDIRVLFDRIKDNHVTRLLKEMGYKYVHFKSTWTATESNKFADYQVGLSTSILVSNEFLRVFFETTMLKMLVSRMEGSLARYHLYSLEEIKKVPEIKEPTFTFYHVLMPHHPFLFDREGNILKEKTKYDQFEDSNWGEGEAYIEQLVFVNKKITEAVEEILKKSEIEPIIIIQSDHGPQRRDKSKSEFIDIRLGNLNALYFPGKSKKIFSETMTPVNNFRLLFNQYFNAKYPLLEDHSYYSEFRSPYFINEINQ